jgi:hypothetical protein
MHIYFSKPMLVVAERNQQKPTTSQIHKAPNLKIVEDIKKRNIKRSVTVRLASKVSKEALGQIAKKIRKADKNNYKRTFILYYLPEMEIGMGAWATTHFNPELKVVILGLSLEEEKALKSKKGETTRDEIGAWITESLPGILTIYRKNESYIQEWQFNDGSKLTRHLIKKSSSKGMRLEEENNHFGEYYIINSANNLETWDRSGLISTSKRVPK